MALDMSSIGVSIASSVIIVSIVIIIVLKKLMIPVLQAVIDEKMQDTQDMMSAAASVLGTRSGESRQYAKLEEMAIDDIIATYPEIELALERFSPETAEYIRDHPRAALILYQRYKPYIDQFTGAAAQERQKYDIG